MLFLTNDHNPIGHRHIDFVVVVPVIWAAAIAQRHIEIVIVLARCLNSLRYTHLFTDVLCVMTFLENRILFITITVVGWTAWQSHFTCVAEQFLCYVFATNMCVSQCVRKSFKIVVQGKKSIVLLVTPYWIIQLHFTYGSHSKCQTSKLVRSQVCVCVCGVLVSTDVSQLYWFNFDCVTIRKAMENRWPRMAHASKLNWIHGRVSVRRKQNCGIHHKWTDWTSGLDTERMYTDPIRIPLPTCRR